MQNHQIVLYKMENGETVINVKVDDSADTGYASNMKIYQSRNLYNYL